MSAIYIGLMPLAVNSRCTRFGAVRGFLCRLLVHHAPAPTDAAQPVGPHARGDVVVTRLEPLVSEIGLDFGLAVGRIAGGVGLAALLQQDGVGVRLRAGRLGQPVAVTAGRDTQGLAHGAHRKIGLVRFDEFVNNVGVFSLPVSLGQAANQAVAFANRSRAC